MKVNYKIKEVMPQTYCVIFNQAYDMCMTFFRWQEYYESNNKRVKKNKKLGFFEAMKTYSMTQGKRRVFVYN